MFDVWFKKAQLKNAFRLADIAYKRTKRLPNGEEHEIKHFPAIVDFQENEEYFQYVFKLPLGLNPKEIQNKEYIFQQMFGKLYDLNGDGLTYNLKVFKKDIVKEFLYNYDEFAPIFSKFNLPIIAGKDIHGNIVAYDMISNPHLLIAGETGSGKSVMLRSIITSIILHMRERIDLYLGDMKRSEFHVFRNVEGVKAVMTKKQDLYKCLVFIKKELERRGDLLDACEVEHIDEYNKLKGKSFEKYILLAIDEVALLKKEKELMDIVEEISCIGRALGVFLVLSMQRPDSKVLEGQLKNNLTVRYAFRHSDKINSDITLGRSSEADASKIKADEKGKFIMKNEGVVLLQAPFLTLQNARSLLEPFKVAPHIHDGEIIDVEYEENDDFMDLPVLRGNSS
ncbi:FtsK/SpoIIIE domain-containing protein [Weizmannia sp. CD-2023]|uniref:FtsK/SpoIIIE domain-containing protein n=1 Tax=Heyndrickxia TaxID=2837504 RepID=UPI002E251E0D|nr:FtsK/SpoIIIE domain-containing protein [Weizmannia sp. CD-2023]MED4840421.1 FtsK/SpoIIIE domain-containing protein [Weizmannia sp. CD-2023]MED4899736.1 FtsK/SpoIIIE domain-containing protein [Weizmannia sp. CD-2023]